MGQYVTTGGGFFAVPDACLTDGHNATTTGPICKCLSLGAIWACAELRVPAGLQTCLKIAYCHNVLSTEAGVELHFTRQYR